MKRSIIKKIAINLAFFQLFSTQLAKASDNDNKIDYTLQKDVIEQYQPEIDGYLILESEELKPVSIFDYENIKTKQFGANQLDMKNHFKTLIKDPVVWDEMQKYLPATRYDSKEDALFIYQKYFDLITDSGCGYASATNFIFKMFEGREEEFEKVFGFPMYTYDERGNIDFNYEILMLKFFNYSVLGIDRSAKEVERAIARDFYEYKIDYYRKNRGGRRVSREEIAKWTEKDWDNYRKEKRNNEKKLEEYQEKYARTKKEEFNFGIELKSKFGRLSSFLAQYGIKLQSTLKNGLGKAKIDEIIASDDFKLYDVNSYKEATYSQDVDEHYVYVTEITPDGKIIVSSWGDMFIFDNSKAKWTKKILLKMSK